MAVEWRDAERKPLLMRHRQLWSKKCSLLRNRSLICTFYYVSFPVLCRHLNKICL